MTAHREKLVGIIRQAVDAQHPTLHVAQRQRVAERLADGASFATVRDEGWGFPSPDCLALSFQIQGVLRDPDLARDVPTVPQALAAIVAQREAQLERPVEPFEKISLSRELAKLTPSEMLAPTAGLTIEPPVAKKVADTSAKSGPASDDAVDDALAEAFGFATAREFRGKTWASRVRDLRREWRKAHEPDVQSPALREARAMDRPTSPADAGFQQLSPQQRLNIHRAQERQKAAVK